MKKWRNGKVEKEKDEKRRDSVEVVALV